MPQPLFQRPRGTRDFYPEAQAVRLYLVNLWRQVSIRHGFEEVDGPVYESLDLYTHKSGEGIVSELFSFTDRGGRVLAIRPEFTPTLARMVATEGAARPKPMRWFSVPVHCRAERPQRGRLREFLQWNVDIIGDASPDADVEILATVVDFLSEAGFTAADMQLRINHRAVAARLLGALGVPARREGDVFGLLDRRDKIPPERFVADAEALGMSSEVVQRLVDATHGTVPLAGTADELRSRLPLRGEGADELFALHERVHAVGIAEWCSIDMGIVRGLDYYTGMVFEVHESTGAERAIAGGGRYDHLIESFGGPPLPACGFGMGDVVLGIVMEERGLFPTYERLRPAPTVFLINSGGARADALAPGLLFRLRRAGLYAAGDPKSGRSVKKQARAAAKSDARWSLTLGQEAERGEAVLIDLRTDERRVVPLDGVEAVLQGLVRDSACRGGGAPAQGEELSARGDP